MRLWCDNPHEHRREAENDFHRGGRYGYDREHERERNWNDCSKEYMNRFDELRRDQDRQEERREEERMCEARMERQRHEARMERQRHEAQMDEQRQQDEMDAHYSEQERQYNDALEREVQAHYEQLASEQEAATGIGVAAESGSVSDDPHAKPGAHSDEQSPKP